MLKQRLLVLLELGWRLLYLSLNRNLLRLSIRSKVQSLKEVNVVENKTSSSHKKRVETFVPKPKHKSVKAVYKVKCSVSDKTDSVNSDNVVLPEKGQFFKYVRPQPSLGSEEGLINLTFQGA